jgi:hypothetical protein
MMIAPQIGNPAGIFPKFYVIWRELAGYVPVTGPPENVQSKGVPQSSLFLIVIFDPLTDFDFVCFRKKAVGRKVIYRRLWAKSIPAFKVGLKKQKFCCPACRKLFHQKARKMGEAALLPYWESDEKSGFRRPPTQIR